LISFSDLRPKFFGLEHFGFRLLHQLADGPDVRVLQTVVRTHGELELLDALVQVLVEHAGARLLGLRVDRLTGIFEVDEDVQVIANQLGGERHGFLRGHRAVGPHIDRQLVVVGGLAETRRLDEVVHLLHRRVDRVDRNPADAEVLVEVLVADT
jgi:hypothetical protein